MIVIEALRPLLVDINSVKPDPRNARQHPTRNIDTIKKSLEAYGQRKPIVVNQNTNFIEAGNGMWEAAKSLGWTQIAVVKVNDDKDVAKAFGIMDNQSALLADWDLPTLKDLLQELDDGSVDMDLTGFDTKEIEELMTQFHEDNEGLTDDDAIPEDVETVCKTGDLWILGNHKLLCGDATKKEDVERLMDGQKADMVFTDPPYGINYSGGRTQVVSKKAYGKIQGDANSDIANFVMAAIESAGNKDYYICLSPINIKTSLPLFDSYEGIIIWKKPQPGLGYQWIRRYCEFIVFGTKRVKSKKDASEFDYWDIPTDPKNEYQHGTQKPVALATRGIKFSSVVNDVVVDLFGGSGSTLIACEKLDRRCFMVEISPEYCSVILRRWEDFTGKKAIHG